MGTQTCALPARAAGRFADDRPAAAPRRRVPQPGADFWLRQGRHPQQPEGGMTAQGLTADGAVLRARGVHPAPAAAQGAVAVGALLLAPARPAAQIPPAGSGAGAVQSADGRRAGLSTLTRPRTAAGAAASRRRDRRAARRRPSAGVLPSGTIRRIRVACSPPAMRGVVQGYVMSRATRLAMTLTVSVSAVLLALTLASAPSAGGFAQVTVAPGDSLWSIAEVNDPGRDPRDVVDDIRRLNGLGEGALPVGVMLTVPVSGD